MSRWNLLGCVLTGLLLGTSAIGSDVAVSVTDLGRGPQNASPDQNHDIIRHDPSSGRVTLHFMTSSGIDLIESEFTLDGLEIADGFEGEEYSAGSIIFNNNGTSGTGARASYEVSGRITNLTVTSSGSGHINTRPLNDGGIGDGPAEDYGMTAWTWIATNDNENGTDANADIYVAPYPAGDNTNSSALTAFKIISPGSGANIDGVSMPVFNLEIWPTAANGVGFGDIRCFTGSNGEITSIKHEFDEDDDPLADKILHRLSDVLPERSDNVYYFNQLITNGLDVGTDPFIARYKVDGESVQFTTPPVIEFYSGGEVVDVLLNNEGSAFLSPPTEFPNDGGGTDLELDWERRGPLLEITDFDPGSGYKSLPTISLSDPHGEGIGGLVNLLHTEAFQGGPRDMTYVDSDETILLPGGGWTSMPGDFNGDGSMDLFWWNETIGSSMIWILQNGHLVRTGSLPLTGVELKPVVADLDNNGIAEIFWWNSLTGETWVWTINVDAQDWIASSLPSTTVVDLSWEIVTTGSRYGRSCIIWQSSIDGIVGTWTMSTTAPNTVDIASQLTYPTGEELVPGSNWHVIGTGDLNGDGIDGDLLWWAEEYNRIAIWIIGTQNFQEGDYLTYNGQEVVIDAELGGIGSYTSNGHVNLIWNDGLGVVNWQMDRGGSTPPSEPSVPSDDLGEGAGLDAEAVGRDEEGGDPSGSVEGDRPDDEGSSATNYVNAIPYRIGSAWRMNPDGSLEQIALEFFEGLPEDPLGDLPSFGGGLGDLLGDGFELPDLPSNGNGNNPPGDGGSSGLGAIDIPAGVDPCDYVCSFDKDNPATWPPEFQTPPPAIVQGIWDILIDGLLDSYGCAPCAGGGGGVEDDDADALGACCNEDLGACLELTQAECSFPGAEWLGAGTTCDDDCN